MFVQQSASPVLAPPHRLVGFSRVELAAAESRSVTLQFPVSPLAATPGDIDSTAVPVMAPGRYTVQVPTRAAPNDLFPTASPPLQADFTVN
jgi:beta-glucosidase